MKKFAVLLVVAVIMIGCASALYAGSTIYGMSGLIETPNDSIVAAKSVTLSASRIFSDADITTFGGAVGIFPKLEISAVGIDNGGNTEGLVNAKYRILTETVDKPSVTIGVVDITQRLDHMFGVDGMSSFIVIGKNISNVAEDVSGTVSKPIRGTVGVGTGLYRGVFAGLNMSLAPKFSVAVEYLSKGFRDETTFSGMIRFTPIDALSIDAGLIGFKDFYVGASFNLSTF